MIAEAEPMAPSKVLIIDDERGPRESLRILLKQEFDVNSADSVDKGVELLREYRPDLVIMDIRMPGKDGIEGLREIREIDPVVSVVMLTGYGALETAQQALRLGANDYLNKPFDTSDMKHLVYRYTQRSQLEKKRMRILRELQEMNTRLLADLADREQMASVGESSTEFAHDLRNPLMIISGYVDLLSRKLKARDEFPDSEPEDVDEYLNIIGQNVRRCCDLAQMWQKLGKSDLSRLEPTLISQIIDDLVVGVEPLASSEEVEIEYLVKTNGATINGSRAQLLRAMHNIVANAIQAVPARTGKVSLTCECVDNRARIRIKDNGIGMSEAVLKRLFDPYFTTKPDGEGTGLGTVVAKKIVEEHAGTIEVDSTPGEGTAVTIKLPLLQRKGTAPDY